LLILDLLPPVFLEFVSEPDTAPPSWIYTD
jgi:hypothetical protein